MVTRSRDDNVCRDFALRQCSSTCDEEGYETRYVACILQLEDAEMVAIDEEYCDMDAMPDSERPCWLGDCPELIPTPPTAAAVTTAAVAADSTAHWRTGTWGPVNSSLSYQSVSRSKSQILPDLRRLGQVWKFKARQNIVKIQGKLEPKYVIHVLLYVYSFDYNLTLLSLVFTFFINPIFTFTY